MKLIQESFASCSRGATSLLYLTTRVGCKTGTGEMGTFYLAWLQSDVHVGNDV